MALTTIDILGAGEAVCLAWDNGSQARFHAIWLRDNALDAQTRSPRNGQRLISLQDIPTDIRVTEAIIHDGDLELQFAPENKLVSFSAAWLLDHVYDLRETPRCAKTPKEVETWDGTLNADSLLGDFNAISRDRDALCGWLELVRRFGVARLTGGPIQSGALMDVAALFGYVRETNYGRWFDVRTEVDPDNLANTGLGLQAHTDNPYRDPAPTMQILYCLENSVDGGENRVVDGYRVVERMQGEDPDGLALLSEYCARFEFRGSEDVFLSARRPVVELSPTGELVAIRFNNRSAAPFTDVPFDKMRQYYAAYRRFGELVNDASMGISFKLQAGECFIVDNTRVLHGRTGYADSAGSRWLQGCYPDKDGLQSTLAVLKAQRFGHAA